MAGQITGIPQTTNGYSVHRTRQNVLREQVLAQFRQKSREIAPLVQQARMPAQPGPPPKGSMLDVYA